METIQEILSWLWTFDGIKVIVCHTAINFVVAIATALYVKDFDFRRVAEWLYTKLLPYVMIYGAVKMLGVEAGLEWLALPVWALIETTLTGDLVDNLGKLGVPIPEQLARLIGTH